VDWNSNVPTSPTRLRDRAGAEDDEPLVRPDEPGQRVLVRLAERPRVREARLVARRRVVGFAPHHRALIDALMPKIRA
jgi:hypothetical protein